MSQNHAWKFPISLSVHQPVTQTDLHPLWNVHLWVSESPPSHSSSLLEVGRAVLSLCVAVQETTGRVTLNHGVSDPGAQGGSRACVGTLPPEMGSHPCEV